MFFKTELKKAIRKNKINYEEIELLEILMKLNKNIKSKIDSYIDNKYINSENYIPDKPYMDYIEEIDLIEIWDFIETEVIKQKNGKEIIENLLKELQKNNTKEALMHIEYLYKKINEQHFNHLGTQILIAMYNLDLLSQKNTQFNIYKKIDKNNYIHLSIISDFRYNIKGALFFFQFNDSNTDISYSLVPNSNSFELDYLANIDGKQGQNLNNFIDKIFLESSFVEVYNSKEYSSYFTIQEIFDMNKQFKEHENKNFSFENFKNIKNKYLKILEERKIMKSDNFDKEILRLKSFLDNEKNSINKLIFFEKNIYKIINAYYNKQKINMYYLFQKIKNIK